MKKLPSKMSALLRLAVRDCIKVEKMKTRMLDMGVFHTSGDKYQLCEDQDIPKQVKCVVCMAGAVMDRTLKVSVKDEWPSKIGKVNRDKMFVIDEMRGGYFAEALESNTTLLETDTVTNRNALDEAARVIYNSRARQYRSYAEWDEYLRAADILEKGGY